MFTSAFIVLLLTAYSQIKFNKNIIDFQEKIDNSEKSKNNFIINLNSAVQENKKIKDELDKIKLESAGFQEEIEKYKSTVSVIENNHEESLSTYEKLLFAEGEYKDGEYIVCAEALLKEIDKGYLKSEAVKLYEELVNKSFEKAAHQLYNEGYSSLKKKDYTEAIEKFSRSYALIQGEYYSDDCIYFIGYSEYKLQNIEGAISNMELLKQKYPNSTYSKDAENLLKMMGK